MSKSFFMAPVVLAAGILTSVASAGCRDLLALGPGSPPGDQPDAPVRAQGLDGVTQSTPLVVGQVVDRLGSPVAGVRVRVYEGYFPALDGVTQSTPLDGVTQTTPLDGVTQTTPLDGVTQTTPLDGVTQSTPFDGVTQSTPVERTGQTGDDGSFAIRAPDRSVLSIEAGTAAGDVGARLAVPVDRRLARLDVGRLVVDRPGSISGRVVAPSGTPLEGVAVFVPGSDRVARADGRGAYRLAGVPAGTVRVAAVKPRFKAALVSGVAVAAGREAAAPDLVLVPARPVLLAAVPDSGGPGALIALRGVDLGHSVGTPYEIRFGTVRAAWADRTSDAAAAVRVPEGAGGPVTIVSDGVPSAPLAFTVIASVSLGPVPARAAVGEAIPLSASARDAAGLLLAAPALSWSVSPSDLAARDDRGRLVARRAGFGTVAVETGTVRAVAPIGFGEWAAATVLGPVTGSAPREGPEEGAAGEVRLEFPGPVAVRGDDLLFVDRGDGVYGTSAAAPRVRALGAGGRVTAVAGMVAGGYDGDGLAATATRLSAIAALAVGPAGDLFLADTFNFRIRAVPAGDGALLGRTVSGGAVWNLMGDGDPGPAGRGRWGDADGDDALAIGMGNLEALAWDPAGALWLAETYQDGGALRSRVRRMDAAGRVRAVLRADSAFPETRDVAVEPDRFEAAPRALATDPEGNLYIGTGFRVWMWCARSGTYYGTAASRGQVVALAGTGERVARAEDFNGEEGPGRATRLWNVTGLAILPDRLILVDSGFHRVRELDAGGNVRTLAGGGTGTGDLALHASLSYPRGVAAGPAGSLYLSDRLNNRILRLTRR